MTELELDAVTKVFQDGNEGIVAVDDVSLTLGDGEFLVVVGPSGCGKSTTLRMVAGLETVTDGEIRLDDRLLNDVKAQDRDMAMVFQSYALYPHMTVRGNMAFGLEESTDLSEEEISDSVEETAEMMGIGNLLGRKPTELSGGQQQRVALGRAIVRDPAVFLMDEPLSNLDAKLRSQMRTELQRLQADLDVTTMYVTHDQTEAMTMGDRIAILDGGELQQVSTPLDCYHRPNNQFVAGFIGEPSMNFFEVDRDGEVLVAETFTYPISASIADAVGEETELVLGVRPGDVELVDTGAPGDHEYAATVDVIEPMGDDNTVYLALGERCDDENTIVATTDGLVQLEAGADAVIRIPEEAIHVFARGSGETLHNRELEDPAELETP